MLKTFMTMTAVSALMLGSAAAQSSNDVKQQPAPPAASSTTAPPSGSAASSASGVQFVNSQQADQWVASKFEGVDVLGPDNKKVGDVSDILFDKNGQILAYIVSVGGFLGMGSKYIALPPNAFQVTMDSGTTGSATTSAPSEQKLKISMTEEQLKQAANFEYYKPPAPAASTGTATPPAGTRSPNAPTGMK